MIKKNKKGYFMMNRFKTELLTKLMARKEYIKNKKTIKGFTLIELIIVLVILGLLAGVVTSNYNPDSAKAKVLLTNNKEVADTLLRFRMDTGCYPKNMQALFDQTKTLSNTVAYFCAKGAQQNSWRGPYITPIREGQDEAGTGTISGSLSSDNISPAAYTKIYHDTAANFHYYYILTEKLPDSIAQEYMSTCLGIQFATDTSSAKASTTISSTLAADNNGLAGAAFSKGYKCLYKADTTGTDSAEVAYLVQQTR
jgi:general secretion pathway protein G